jgi:isopentenyl-diphosphate delta-isomerase
MIEQQLILVDENDRPVGTMEKMEAHHQGLLHRAFSVFIFDGKGKMLLQQRALTKYHGGGLWTNACCSHPFVGEATETAALRRLEEEMGFTTGIKKIFQFTYKAAVENGLTEHEYDHVFAGEYEGEINPNPEEVAAYKYETLTQIKQAIKEDGSEFTSWFKIAFPRVESWWQMEYGAKTKDVFMNLKS